MPSEALVRIKLHAKNMTGPAFMKVRRSLLRIRRLGKRAFQTVSKYARSAQVQILGLVAAMGGFRALVTGPAEFNRELARTATLGEEARARIDEFGDAVRDLSVASGVAPDQLADGLFNVISAGTQAADAMGVLEEATILAVAGQSDLTAAVKGLATVANSFSLTGQEGFREIAENLFAAQVIGKTTIEDLANNIGKLGAVAANSSIPMDQLFTALSEVTQVANNTEEASTGLRAAIIAIKKPTTEMKEILIDLGIPLGDAAFKGRNLGEMFAGIRRRAKELGIPMEVVVGQVRAVTAALILGEEGGDRYNRALEKQRRLMGELSISYDVMQKELATTLDRTKNFATVLAQDFSAGALTGLNEGLQAALSDIRVMRVEARISGLEFRKSIETDVLPGLDKVTNSFKFMFHSTRIVINSIHNAFDWLMSSIVEGVRETINFMETMDLIESPIDRYNADMEKFIDRAVEAQKEMEKLQAQALNPAQVSQAEKALNLAVFVGGNSAEADRLGKLLQDQTENLSKQADLIKKIKFQEEDRLALIKRRAGLRAMGARGMDLENEKNLAQAIDLSGTKLAQYYALRLTGTLRVKEALADITEQVDLDNRMLQRRKEMFESADALEKILPITARPVDVEILNQINAGLREARNELEQIRAGLPGTAAGWEALTAIHTKGIADPIAMYQELSGVIDEVTAKELEKTAAVVASSAAIKESGEALALYPLTLEEFRWSLLETAEGWSYLLAGFDAWKTSFTAGMEDALRESKALNEQIRVLGNTMVRTAESAVARFFDGVVTGSLTAREAFANFLRAIASEINRFLAKQAVAKFVEFFLTMGMGGGSGGGSGESTIQFPGGEVRQLASGGIVSRPEVSLIGEAGPEAVVPLPNGRSIPVDFRGATRGGGDTFNINISAVDGASVQRLLASDSGRRAIQNAMRDARSTRRDLR